MDRLLVTKPFCVGPGFNAARSEAGLSAGELQVNAEESGLFNYG